MVHCTYLMETVYPESQSLQQVVMTERILHSKTPDHAWDGCCEYSCHTLHRQKSKVHNPYIEHTAEGQNCTQSTLLMVVKLLWTKHHQNKVSLKPSQFVSRRVCLVCQVILFSLASCLTISSAILKASDKRFSIIKEKQLLSL